MGLDISLQDEDGEILESVGDPNNILHELLPSFTDYSYQCLRFIDWYGNTIFNRFQIDVFLAEWKRLYSKAHTENEREILFRIEELAKMCQSEPHFYLKFEGD